MILLIQFRTDQSGTHEVSCIYSGSGIPYDELETLNAFSIHNTTEDIVRVGMKADGIILGGCGESGYEEKDVKKIEKLEEMKRILIPALKELISNGKKIIGICYGHQLLSEFYEANVIQDKGMAETGAVEITLTKEGVLDPLFNGFDKKFLAIEAHKSSVELLPKQAVLLASSERCSVQSFRMGENVYGVQFHAELDYADLDARLRIYPGYMENSVDNKGSKELMTKKLLSNFIKICS